MLAELKEHRHYLSDETRSALFRRAIEETVKPGNVVLDLGCGTGVLGLMACRAGASRVYALDATGMLEVARNIYRANGFQDRVTFFNQLSLEAKLPERVDVVIADQMGGFGTEAGLCEFFLDARQRFLKPGGILLPQRLDLCLCLVEAPEIWEQISFWDAPRAGFDFRPLRARAANILHKVELQPEQGLSREQPAFIFDFTAPATGRSAEVTLEVTRAGVLHGLAGFFRARLSASAQMTNSPWASQRIKRHLAFFPLAQPVTVQPGDQARVTMRIHPADNIYTWQIKILEAGAETLKASFNHSTFRSLFVTSEDLQRTLPHSKPCLSAQGMARQTVLQLCDGQHSLSEIEQLVYQAHSDILRSPADAAAFVARVINRNCL